jgi:hypothetical protein
MIATNVLDMTAHAKPVERCPICNARAGNIVSDWTDYLCGARVVAASHGSWSIAAPCPNDGTV